MGSEPKFCCSIEQCAGALGYPIPKQRNRKAALLKQVREWSENSGLPKGCPPWPVKGKNGYWVRKQVVALARWLGQGKVESGKRKAESGNGKHPTSSGSVASPATIRPLPQPELDGTAGGTRGSTAEGELFAGLESGFEATLDQWEDKLKFPDKWVQAPIQLWQLKLLQKHRPHLFQAEEADGTAGTHGSTGPEDGINLGGGVRGVANYINRNYPWVPCHHMRVQRWITSDELPSGCREPFPASYDGAGRWRKAQVDAWVVRYFPRPAQGQELAVNIDSYREQMERRRLDHEEWVRQQERAAADKNYVRVDVLLDYAGELGRAVF